MKRILLYCIFLLSFSLAANAQEEQKTRILFILDASQSMHANWGNQSRMNAAKIILSEIVDTLKNYKSLEMALRVYGHQYNYTTNNCKDTRLEVPFSPNNYQQIKNKISNINARGITPIAYSLERSEKDFPAEDDARNVIILITDGEESCNGNPCEVSAALQRKGIVLKPFVIGLVQSSDLAKKMDCVGSYYEASSAPDFKNILRSIIKLILDETTAQVDLLDQNNFPLETDVNMSFFNPVSNTVAYNYYHTINARGNSDTIEVDPLINYDLIVHSIPSIERKNVTIEPNKHNIIKIPAAQGQLKLVMQTTETSPYGNKVKSLIRQSGEINTMHVQPINSTEKYLAGKYDIEILTLPRILIKNISVEGSKTTTLQIPEPGFITFYSSMEIFGAIFVSENNKLQKIYQLNDRILKETIALQPGNYVVIYRNKMTRDSNLTVQKQFKVVSGQSGTVKL